MVNNALGEMAATRVGLYVGCVGCDDGCAVGAQTPTVGLATRPTFFFNQQELWRHVIWGLLAMLMEALRILQSANDIGPVSLL